MNMTVGALRDALAKLDPNLDVLLAVNHKIVPAVGVTSASGIGFIVLRGKEKSQPSNRFTTDEDGLIGYLSGQRMNDAGIGDVLGRPAESVTRRKKTLGM